jgi:hypothetical protein
MVKAAELSGMELFTEGVTVLRRTSRVRNKAIGEHDGGVTSRQSRRYHRWRNGYRFGKAKKFVAEGAHVPFNGLFRGSSEMQA